METPPAPERPCFSSSFDTPNSTTQIAAPGTAGTYYLHFHVTYSGGTGTAIDWDSAAINATNVVYAPNISFASPASFNQFNGSWTAPRQPIDSDERFRRREQAGDLRLVGFRRRIGHPQLHDGSNRSPYVYLDRQRHGQADGRQHHENSGDHDSAELASTTTPRLLQPPPPPPPPPPGGGGGGVTVGISGLSSVVTGTPSTWTASVSGGTPSSYSWLWSDNSFNPSGGSSVTRTFSTSGLTVTLSLSVTVSGAHYTATKTVTSTTAGGPPPPPPPPTGNTPSAAFTVTGALFSQFGGTYTAKAGDVVSFQAVSRRWNSPAFHMVVQRRLAEHDRRFRHPTRSTAPGSLRGRD